MRHLHPHVPANHRSQAEGSRAALTASVIHAEKCPSGPGENKARESSSGLLATLLAMSSSRALWTTRALRGAALGAARPHGPTRRSLPTLFPRNPPPAPCIPPFLLCSRLSLLSQLLLSASLEQRPRCFSSPTAGETWRDAHPGEDAHLAPPRTWERTLSPSQRRDTPNDLPYQSPQVHFTSLSSRLKGKAGIR